MLAGSMIAPEWEGLSFSDTQAGCGPQALEWCGDGEQGRMCSYVLALADDNKAAECIGNGWACLRITGKGSKTEGTKDWSLSIQYV